MKKYFIDCGTHLCEGLTDFVRKGIIHEEFEIHTFEANPACKDLITSILSTNFENFNVTQHDKAIWINNEKIFFHQEFRDVYGSPEKTGLGSSVSGIGFEHPGLLDKIEISAISFSEFLSNINNDSYVICKMDIEGAEFKVLRHLIDTGSIKKINELFVEFHHRFMPEESEIFKNQLVCEIESLGVKINQWF
jgi:FkbM family methyltransferase